MTEELLRTVRYDAIFIYLVQKINTNGEPQAHISRPVPIRPPPFALVLDQCLCARCRFPDGRTMDQEHHVRRGLNITDTDACLAAPAPSRNPYV